MATSRDELKSYFKQFSTPTESQFAKLIDSAPNLNDDGLEKSAGTPLKITASAGDALQKVLEFKEATDNAPAWTLQLKTPEANGASGLAIVKGKDKTSVLFIDEGSGRIDINGSVADGLMLRVNNGGATFKGPLHADGSAIYFTNTNLKHTGVGNKEGHAAIENDSEHFKSLMILGRWANGTRVVSIHDILKVPQGAIIPNNEHGIQFKGTSTIINYKDEILKIKNDKPIKLQSGKDAEMSISESGKSGVLGGGDLALNMEVNGNLNISAYVFELASQPPRRFNKTINLIGTVKANDKTILVDNGSDERLKKDIQPLHYGLNTINKLNPVSFNWKNRVNTQKTLGLIAQQVEPIIPEATFFDEHESNGHGWSISYNSLIPVLINAIKELDQKVKDLQGKK